MSRLKKRRGQSSSASSSASSSSSSFSSDELPFIWLYLCVVMIACLVAMGMVLYLLSTSIEKDEEDIEERKVPFIEDTKGQHYSHMHYHNEHEPSVDEWDYPLVHIVNTRFMQEQGHLLSLGKARLHLFISFCLPTMKHQTTQEFIWIIKTDPHLHHTIRDELIEHLRSHPNFFLVGSNNNYRIGHAKTDDGESWRNGDEGNDILKSPIYTGDTRLLHHAHRVRNLFPILETRLDADDGLHSTYIDYVQKTALETLVPSSTTTNTPHYNWMYWCSRRHIEWFNNNGEEHIDDEHHHHGNLNIVQHSKLCITPGITVGFAVGTIAKTVPEYAHDKLYKAIEKHGGCTDTDADETDNNSNNNNNMDCIQLVDDIPFVAIRSRTTTSAGMMDINFQKNLPTAITKKKQKKQLWTYLQDEFFLSLDNVHHTNTYLKNHMMDISEDNLKGQCTSGHSCKIKAMEDLQKLIELNIEGNNNEMLFNVQKPCNSNNNKE